MDGLAEMLKSDVMINDWFEHVEQSQAQMAQTEPSTTATPKSTTPSSIDTAQSKNFSADSPYLLEPFRVHVSNISPGTKEEEIYYFFGGPEKVFAVYLYQEGNQILHGDFLVHLRSVEACCDALKKKMFKGRKIRVDYVDRKANPRRFEGNEQIDLALERYKTYHSKNGSYHEKQPYRRGDSFTRQSQFNSDNQFNPQCELRPLSNSNYRSGTLPMRVNYTANQVLLSNGGQRQNCTVGPLNERYNQTDFRQQMTGNYGGGRSRTVSSQYSTDSHISDRRTPSTTFYNNNKYTNYNRTSGHYQQNQSFDQQDKRPFRTDHHRQQHQPDHHDHQRLPVQSDLQETIIPPQQQQTAAEEVVTSPVVVQKPTAQMIFGDAKPVDQTKKLQDLEKKLQKERDDEALKQSQQQQQQEPQQEEGESEKAVAILLAEEQEQQKKVILQRSPIKPKELENVISSSEGGYNAGKQQRSSPRALLDRRPGDMPVPLGKRTNDSYLNNNNNRASRPPGYYPGRASHTSNSSGGRKRSSTTTSTTADDEQALPRETSEFPITIAEREETSKKPLTTTRKSDINRDDGGHHQQHQSQRTNNATSLRGLTGDSKITTFVNSSSAGRNFKSAAGPPKLLQQQQRFATQRDDYQNISTGLAPKRNSFDHHSHQQRHNYQQNRSPYHQQHKIAYERAADGVNNPTANKKAMAFNDKREERDKDQQHKHNNEEEEKKQANKIAVEGGEETTKELKVEAVKEVVPAAKNDTQPARQQNEQEMPSTKKTSISDQLQSSEQRQNDDTLKSGAQQRGTTKASKPKKKSQQKNAGKSKEGGKATRDTNKYSVLENIS